MLRGFFVLDSYKKKKKIIIDRKKGRTSRKILKGSNIFYGTIIFFCTNTLN